MLPHFFCYYMYSFAPKTQYSHCHYSVSRNDNKDDAHEKSIVSPTSGTQHNANEGSMHIDDYVPKRQLTAQDDVQMVLHKPLSTRHKELIARSFMLGVVMADSAENRKRKRLLRLEERSISGSSDQFRRASTPEFEIQNDDDKLKCNDQGKDDSNYFSQRHPILEELTENAKW